MTIVVLVHDINTRNPLKRRMIEVSNMGDENKDLIRRWFEEVWNQGQYKVVDEMLAPNAPSYGLGGGGEPVRGPEALKAFQQGFRAAFPDIHVEVEDILAEEDRVAARFSARATHTGDFLGIPPTGQTVIIPGMCIVRVRDGRIVESWNHYDLFGLLRQMGAKP